MTRQPSRRRRLDDAYRFHGFRPLATVRGVFGDPRARVVTLQRRSKKRYAAFAARRITTGTITKPGEYGIYPAATRACTLNSSAGVFYAGRAAA